MYTKLAEEDRIINALQNHITSLQTEKVLLQSENQLESEKQKL